MESTSGYTQAITSFGKVWFLLEVHWEPLYQYTLLEPMQKELGLVLYPTLKLQDSLETAK